MGMKIYGYGDGYGHGGYGDSYGYHGYGDGDGHGYGYGYRGDGDGHGDGYGYEGYGCGYYGYYGDGYGCGEEDMSAYLAALVGDGGNGLVLAIWRSNRDGTPANGGGGEPVCEGLVQEVEGPLELCSPRALHATLAPLKWQGERWWIVGLHEPVAYGEDKIGSLKRTILKDLGCPRFTNESQ